MLGVLPNVVCVALILVFLVFPAWLRMVWKERQARAQLGEAVASGRNEPVTIQPLVDPGACMGSGTCVRACPEDVLRVVDGQAVVVDGAACVGHGACAAVCPVDAITLVFGSETRGVELPRVGPDFETNVPGLYVAGELGGMGLIANAVEQGTQAAENALRGTRAGEVPELAIVGAGPAGLAAAAVAIERGARYVVLEQGEFGGAIRHYPRQKLVFSRPMRFRGAAPIRATTLRKEELVAALERVVAATGMQVRTGVRVDAVAPVPGGFEIRTTHGVERAQRVILAVGRRGTPRKLGVPGEALEKVAYWLTDPELYRSQHLLVVGGGDSAVEAAVALSEQPGNRVWLSYRRDRITRPKKKNLERLRAAVRAGRVELLLGSEVVRIGIDRVVLTHDGDELTLPNDFVFVFAGGVLPTGFLKAAGVRVETHYGPRVERAEPPATPAADEATVIRPVDDVTVIRPVPDDVTVIRAPAVDPPTALRPRRELRAYLASLDGAELTRPIPAVDDEGTRWVLAVDPAELAPDADGLDAAEEALAQVRDARGLARALGALARGQADAGRHDLADALLDEGWARPASAGAVRASALRALAALAIGRGDLDEADARLGEAWDLALTFDGAEDEARACRTLADVRAIQGRLVEAAELLDRAHERLSDGDARLRASILARRVEVRGALGRYGGALQDGEDLLDLARRHRLTPWLPEAAARLGGALVAVGFRDLADAAADLGLELLGDAGWRARIALARLMSALGRPDAVQLLAGAPPDDPIDDPTAQVVALRGRRREILAALERPPARHPVRAAIARLDAARALLAADDAASARAACARGLALLRDTDALGARLELLVGLRAAGDQRAREGIGRAARRVLIDLPSEHAAAFRARPGIADTLSRSP